MADQVVVAEFKTETSLCRVSDFLTDKTAFNVGKDVDRVFRLAIAMLYARLQQDPTVADDTVLFEMKIQHLKGSPTGEVR